jgi:transposase-like protein
MKAETEAKWRGRAEAWRESGKSAEDFSAGKGFEASTLRYWASRLQIGAKAAAPASAPSRVPMARVIRRTRGRAADSPAAETTLSGELAVVVGGARIAVVRGFDAELLREVVLALGGAK